MIEVVFNDSLCGTIKLTDSQRASRNRIYSFPIDANIGDLSRGILSEQRRKALNLLWQNETLLPDTQMFTQYHWKKYRRQMREIAAACEGGESVRFWASDGAEDLCGLMAFSDLLKNTDGNIFVIYLNETALFQQKPVRGWGVYSPQSLEEVFPFTRSFTLEERRILSDQYLSLCQSRGTLRVTENGTVKNVPEDHYDRQIADAVPEGVFTPLQLMSEVMCRSDVAMPFHYLLYRCTKILLTDEYTLFEQLAPGASPIEFHKMQFQKKLHT